MVQEMRSRVAESAYRVTATGVPSYIASNPVSARILEQATFVTLMDEWDAADGEGMMLLVLRDEAGQTVGALPAPADDEVWLAALESSPVMHAMIGRAKPRELVVRPG